MLLAALVALVASAGAAVAGPAAWEWRAGALIAAVGCAIYWVRGYRRGSFPVAGELAEAIAVLVVTRAAPGEPLLVLFVILFRTLYGAPAVAALRALLMIGVLDAAATLRGYGPSGSDAGRIVGVIVGAVLMECLRSALHRYELSERRLRSLIQSSADAIVIVDPALFVRWQSPSIKGVLGFSVETLIGTELVDVVHPQDWRGFVRTLEVTAPPRTATVPVRLRGATDEFHEVEAVVANLIDDPAVEGYVLTLRDATERRRLERERAALAVVRGRVEAERERQELERRLQRVERLESVGQIAGGIAHDFNNILAVIRNYSAFVRDELGEDHELYVDVEEIHSAAGRGAKLTSQLLVFGQRNVTAPEALDLNALLDDVRGLLKGSIADDVRLVYRHAEGLPAVEFDPVSLEQIVVNLAINARDALGGDGGTITIETKLAAVRAGDVADLQPGHYALLTVSDDGAGMDAATLKRATEPFFTTKPSGKGTGLGLATVDRLVSSAGGALAIDSRPGTGTTVSIHLPVTDRSPAETEAAAASPDAANGESVLVVEDEPALAAIVERVLTKGGYATCVAGCAEDALVLLEDPTYDPELLLTDVVMPGMNGVDLATRVLAERPEIGVLFMSAYSDRLLDPSSITHGRLLSKPFDPDELLRRVRSTLDATAGQPVADLT